MNVEANEVKEAVDAGVLGSGGMLSSVHVTIAQEPGCDTAPQPSSHLPRLAADQQNLLFIQNEQWCEAKARTTPGWHLLAGALSR